MSVTATVGLGSGYDQILVQLLNLELALNLEMGCASRLLLTAIINCSIVKHVKRDDDVQNRHSLDPLWLSFPEDAGAS